MVEFKIIMVGVKMIMVVITLGVKNLFQYTNMNP